jgi:hypothetical protein
MVSDIAQGVNQAQVAVWDRREPEAIEARHTVAIIGPIPGAQFPQQSSTTIEERTRCL